MRTVIVTGVGPVTPLCVGAATLHERWVADEVAIRDGAPSAFDAMLPSGVSGPFDACRDGFVMGEGAGGLVLEDAESSRESSATILPTVCGVGASCDAHRLTAPRADNAGAITTAPHDAGLEP
jgi:acyl transferase domain-containing protein